MTAAALDGVRAVVLDMGGVVLDLGEGRGLPTEDEERRGRGELSAAVEAGGGRLDDPAALDLHLFEPWREVYRTRYERLSEAPWEPHLERLREATGTATPAHDLLAAWFRPAARAFRLLPGAGEALERLAADPRPVGLVSNVPMPGFLYREVLERLGVLDAFDVTRFSYDHGTRKPLPAMLEEVVAALGRPAAETVMVGDRKDSDVAAGRAVGTRTVWIESRFDRGPEADATIGSLAELPDRLGSPAAAEEVAAGAEERR